MENLLEAVKEYAGILIIAILSASISIAEAGATKSLQDRIRHPRRYESIDIYSFAPLRRAFGLTMVAGMLYTVMTGFSIFKAAFVVINATNARRQIECVLTIVERLERIVSRLFTP